MSRADILVKLKSGVRGVLQLYVHVCETGNEVSVEASAQIK